MVVGSDLAGNAFSQQFFSNRISRGRSSSKLLILRAYCADKFEVEACVFIPASVVTSKENSCLIVHVMLS